MDTIGGDPMLTASHARALELLAAHAAGAFDALDARFGSVHERMRFQQLRRYFSADVVEHILASPEDVVAKPRNVEATVLFADLVGYTKLSERLRAQPELLMSLLNSWLDAGAEAVAMNRGTLDKFIGDCVMAVFGAPFPQPQSELRAVHCALEMMRAVEEISANTGEKLQITVGINSGQMLAGSVGSKKRLEYTVLGDTVNVASRLQSAAVAGEILIGPATGPATAARLDGVRLEDGGVRTLKNHGPVQAYRVLGLDVPDVRAQAPTQPVNIEDTLR
jgi:adenylate cyclase